MIEKDLLAWPAAHVRLALLDESTGPSLVAAQNRRGLVVLVAARPIDRPPRGLGRTPGGCILVIPGALPNRRPVLEVAGCQGFLTTRTGAAAAMEAVAGMTAAGATAGPQRVPRPLASDPTLPVPTARGLAFVGLAGFGALHWMVLLDPAAPEPRAVRARRRRRSRSSACSPSARIREYRVRQAAAAGVALVALALALLGGGVADELLRPDRWGALASGINRGIAALPGVRVPYRGLDEWIRIVIPLGGTVLVTAAAILAFWPRRNRIGFPGPALTLLVALYAVPAVSLDFENEFLRGAALALLVLAFLRLEKLRVGDAGNAGLVAAGGGDRGADAGPGARQGRAVVGLRVAGRSAPPPRARRRSRWDHDYGPLDWPRDGRELLRVRAHEAPGVLEGRQPRPPSTAAAGSRTTRSTTDPGVPENAEAIQRGHAGDQGHDPQPLQPRLHHRRLHGLPRVADDPRDAARRRHVGGGPRRCDAATPTPRSSTRRRRTRASAARPATRSTARTWRASAR